MVRIEGDIIINRPPEEVFDLVADERNEPRGILKLLGLLVAWMGRRQERRIWAGLKRLLEGQGVPLSA